MQAINRRYTFARTIADAATVRPFLNALLMIKHERRHAECTTQSVAQPVANEVARAA
jgi:hypothetical protein